MKKNNQPQSRYKHFKGSQETIYRTDESQKKLVTKALKKIKYKRIAFNLISLLLVITIAVSGTLIGKRGVEKFIILRSEMEKQKYADIPDDVLKQMEGMTEEEKWALLYELYPELINVKFPKGILCEYAVYYYQNPQTIGYIRIPDTKVDYPVAQADNNKYYLNHDFYGKATSYGAVFASYKNTWSPLNRNTLLYGHNMEDGSRFAALLNYKNLDYYKKHPIIEFDTIYEKNTWKIVACYITNGSTASDNGYFFDFTFNHCSDACYEEYIEEVQKRAIYDTGVDLLPTDTILTLCTCTYEGDEGKKIDDGRLVIVARKVREGEDPSVDTAKADYKHEPVKYPASYYDDPSENPYKDDKNFYLY